MNGKGEYVYNLKGRIVELDSFFFEKLAARIYAREEETIIIDFSEAIIINSEGLKKLLKIQERLQLGKKFRFRNVSPFIMEIINVTGYSQKFDIEIENEVYVAPTIIDKNNYEKVEEEIMEILKVSEIFLLVDLENTITISFEGLAMLLKIDKRATKRKIHLVLHNVSKGLLKQIDFYEFQDLFTMTFL